MMHFSPFARTLVPLLGCVVAAQDPLPPVEDQAPPKVSVQQPIIVTATRQARPAFESPQTSAMLDAQRVQQQLQARTMPETLKEVPGISVQKTAHGQGSPKFRGQTGFHTLLLVDGIRINDSTWRSGNVEYWNHVDPYSIERFEIVRGPSSVLWGSDAVAGVGQAFQKGANSFEPGVHFHGMQLVRYASAEDSFTTRTETHGNSGAFGWHLGFTYRDYDDLRAGRDVGLLRDTGYYDRDGDAKLTWQLSDQQSLAFGMQMNHLLNVPRTQSTTLNEPWRGITAGTDRKREHDHRRQLYYVQWEATAGAFFERMVATAGYKDRYEREDRVKSNGRPEISAMTVKTPLAALQFENDLGPGRLVWGGDYYHDFVESDFREFNTDGSIRQTRNRGVVAGNADYDLAGVFAEYTLTVAEDLELIGGVRGTYVGLDAKDVDVPGDNVTFNEVNDDWAAVTPSLRAVYRAAETVRVFGGYGQGFRAPNLSDTTRFDVGRSGEQEVPAAGLDPEDYHSFELGGRYDDGEVALQATWWYTLASDQIGRVPTGNLVNGLPEVTKRNVGDGWYAGFELEGSASLALLTDDLDSWSVFAFMDYVDGHLDQLDSSGALVRDRAPALPPPTGEVGVRWEHPQGTRGAEAFVRMAYHVDASHYAPADLSNPQRIPPDGLPGYAVYGLRGWTELDKHLTASLAVENLTDVDYRLMDSGLQEPGTNVILTVRASF